jgi:hypothetical protein
MHIGRVNRGSFEIGLTSAQGQKQEYFLNKQQIVLISTMEFYQNHYVVMSYQYIISHRFSLLHSTISMENHYLKALYCLKDEWIKL